MQENAIGNNTGSATNSEKVDSPKDLVKKLGNSFEDGADGGYPILKWQNGATTEPAKPGIRIESSSGSSIWTVAGVRIKRVPRCLSLMIT